MRLLTCLVVASSLPSRHHPDVYFVLGVPRKEDYHAINTLSKLCHAAGLSRCCQEYMCKPEAFYIRHGGDGRVQTDIRLEIAVLVACGYEVESVKMEMVRRARIER